MTDAKPLGLFEGVGIELEYMIVDAGTLDVLPVCDQLLAAQAGAITSDVEFPDISWSNELALHVVELKTTGPARGEQPLANLQDQFQTHLQTITNHLAPINARLLPTAMHPWMDPHTQMRLWPHDYSPIYEAMNRIFDCRGHGWANLQSLHLNLPFADDEQFGRLHAAIRLILPILPALAASSPYVDGEPTGKLDNRLAYYRAHCDRVPSLTGSIIPEPIFTIDEYHEKILGRIYADLAPHDPEGVLRDEFANARGAIARFSRQTIEIRVIDVQECPAADLAIAAATIGALKLLANETWSDQSAQRSIPTPPLANLFQRAITHAEQTSIDNDAYLACFGWRNGPCTISELWRHIITEIRRELPGELAFCDDTLDTLLTRGCCARRILHAAGQNPTRDDLHRVYRHLSDCLSEGVPFLGTSAATADHL